MAIDKELLETTTDVDDDEDLDTLDRGDDFADNDAVETPEPVAVAKPVKAPKAEPVVKTVAQDEKDAAAEQAADDAAGLERDEQGRFIKKGDAPTGEVVDEDAEATAGGGKDTENIPHRLLRMRKQLDDERVARARLEERLAAIEKPKESPVDPRIAISAELDTLYEAAEEYRVAADTANAAKTQRQIDAKNRELLTLDTQAQVSTATTAATQTKAYNTMIGQLEGGYDVLNPQHEDFDATIVRELEMMTAGYEKIGLPSPQALRKAVTMIFREDPWSDRRTEAAPAKPAAPAVPAKKVDVAATVARDRKQPADIADAGRDTSGVETLDAKTMSDEEFEKLPESKKAEMRGDFG